MSISLFSLLALTWKGGEEMQPVIVVTERQKRRNWEEGEAGRKVFAGAQFRSHTIETIIDHGIDFKILELKREWGESNKWNPSVWEQGYTINQLTKSFSIHVALGHSYREGPHLLIKESGTEYVQHMHAFYAVSFHASVFVIYILYRNIYSTIHLKSYPSLESRLFYYQLNVL